MTETSGVCLEQQPMSSLQPQEETAQKQTNKAAFVLNSNHIREVSVLGSRSSVSLRLSVRRSIIMDIVRGQLDEISRPASGSRTRPGSRVANGPSPDRRRLSMHSSGAMVVLTPEPNVSQVRPDPLDSHINFMDFSTNSCLENLSSDHEFFSEQDGVNTLGTDHIDTGKQYESQLSPQEHINSIILELQISDKSGILSTPDSEEDSADHLSTSDQTKPLKKESDSYKQEDLDAKAEDPQLEEAIEKMKRLDKILVMKQEKERQVKKQGEELRKKLWAELQSANPEGLVECPEVADNTMRFLALTPAGNGSTGEDLAVTSIFHTQLPMEENETGDDERDQGSTGEDLAVTSIFHTQLPMEENETGDDERDQDYQGNAEGVKLSSEASSKNVQNKDTGNQMFTQKKIKVKDFVTKNIELAKEAKNPVLLTDDEKRRLAELLKNVDIETSSIEDTSVPWAVSVAERDGYTPENMHQQQLAEIDAKLQVFVLAEDFPMITSSWSSVQSQNYQGSVSSHVETRPGDEILVQLQDERVHHLRMGEIEQQLKSLETTSSESAPEGVPNLSKDQLTSLLDECIRCQSLGRISENKALEDDSDPSGSLPSPRPPPLTVYNTPRLSESALSQLLEDAYNSGLSPAPSRAEGGSKKLAADIESEDPSYYRSKAMANVSKLAEKLLAVSAADDDKSESEVEKWMSSNNEVSYLTRALEIKQVKKPTFLNDSSLYGSTDKELSTDVNIPTIPKLLHRDDENVADSEVEPK
ncbi:fibrous sheath-interacting protein 1 [Heptranchias perlo]|uniref:fibrous sheath-interacting protein 1 n=1 Tax=Heptranchias perlo TaxID=212740 RepID=UPI00355993C5